MLLYHLSPDPNLEVLEPQKPDLLEAVESAGTKVVKFAPTINGFLNIIGPLNVPMSYEYGRDRYTGHFDPEESKADIDKEVSMFCTCYPRAHVEREEQNIGESVHLYPQFYVYIPDEETTFYIPKTEEVFNQSFTGEVDVLHPIKVRPIGSILIISKSMMMEPKKIKWKGHYINYAPYNYEFVRFDPDRVFLSDIYNTKEEYLNFLNKSSKINEEFKNACKEAYPDHNWDFFDDTPDLDLEIEKVSDRIEQMEMSKKTDPAPVYRSKPKQRNQYSLPKKKKEIVLKK